MTTTTNVNNLKINVLTKEQYNNAEKDENQIYLITDNQEESSKGIIYLIASGADSAIASSENDNITELKNGDRFSITFINALNANATLNINNTGNYPIIDNYTHEAIVLGDISNGYIGDILYKDEQFILLNAIKPLASPQGYQFYTSNNTFIVPVGVTAIRVSACAAGLGIYAGEYLLDRIFNVTPGQSIPLTIGTGNTIIGNFATLIAGAYAGNHNTTKLGYAAGYKGGNGSAFNSSASVATYGSMGGYGGAFGYGGGGGGNNGSSGGQGAGGGAGIGGAGGGGQYNTAGSGGGTTGGNGGNHNTTCGSAKNGALIYIGATDNGNKGGDGSIYGAGGGAGGVKSVSRGGGGAAGGYGAGGGESGRVSDTQASTIYGQPSSGMVLIEWGGTIGE